MAFWDEQRHKEIRRRSKELQKQQGKGPFVFEKKFKCQNCKRLLSDLEIAHTVAGNFCQSCGGVVFGVGKPENVEG